MLPASSSATSPGTTSVTGTMRTSPPRITCALAAVILRSAAIARSARNSWTKPMMALSSTITTIAMVSLRSPMMPEMIAAAISTRIMKSAN